MVDVIRQEVCGGLPWQLLYADDLVLMAAREDELRQKLISWKNTFEAKGLKVTVNKTKRKCMQEIVVRLQWGM